MKVAYFTAGTKGAGHLVRGVAIADAMTRAGLDARLSIVAPADPPFPALRRRLDELDAHLVAIDRDEIVDPDRALGSPLAERMRALDPDLVIVDMFWAPLHYILGELDAEAWLLVRSCPPVWLVGSEHLRFDPRRYARRFAIEPIAHDDVELEPLDPVVICNRDALKSRAELCRKFRVSADQRVVAIAHAGLPGEIHELKTTDRLGPTTALLRFDLYRDGRGSGRGSGVFPLAPWLAAADEIHCSAGYNSYWEARWLGYAARTRLTAIARAIDDPVWRVKHCGGYPMRRNGADALAEMIAAG